MKVKITKPVVLEALEGSIVEISENQYNLIKNYCEAEIETKNVSVEKKEVKKAKQK